MKSSLLVPVVLTFGVTALADMVSRGNLRLKVILGNVVYATFMFLGNEVNSELTTSFAWVVAITVLLTSGVVVFQAIEKGVA